MINGINAFSSPSLHREGAWIERNKANQGDNQNEKKRLITPIWSVEAIPERKRVI
jgi:hypothetical protein